MMTCAICSVSTAVDAGASNLRDTVVLLVGVTEVARDWLSVVRIMVDEKASGDASWRYSSSPGVPVTRAQFAVAAPFMPKSASTLPSLVAAEVHYTVGDSRGAVGKCDHTRGYRRSHRPLSISEGWDGQRGAYQGHNGD